MRPTRSRDSFMKKTKLGTNGLLAFGVILGVVAIPLMVLNVPGYFGQMFAIIASAFLGAGATSWMTRRLLDKQQEADEEKEKNVQIYQNKVKVFSAFICEIWKQSNETDFWDSEVITAIRKLIFNELIFYLDKKELTKLEEIFNRVPKDKGFNGTLVCSQLTALLKQGIDKKDSTKENTEDKNKHTLRKDIQKKWKTFTNKVSELLRYLFGIDKENSIKEDSKDNSYDTLIKNLWNAISDKTNNGDKSGSPDSYIDNRSTTEVIKWIEKTADIQYQQSWHFAMWGEEQLDAIGDGKINELSLVEYGEYWRTNLVKQVGKDDIVFLFRRGGSGYLGAFRPIGWRVFERTKDNTLIETINYYEESKGKNETRQISEKDADVEKYDIYGGIADGATLCTNLIVEIIAYIPNGVGNPGGVYRRTISRYDKGYADTLLERLSK